MIPALVTGDRRGLEPPLWRLFRDLGTAHLLAISGLHLTLVTGLLWGLGRWLLAPLLWLLIPLLKATSRTPRWLMKRQRSQGDGTLSVRPPNDTRMDPTL